MAILSRKDLERISRKMLHQYLKQKNEKITWIDPVDFAERICGIQFVFADIGAGGAVLGLTSFTDVAVTIRSSSFCVGSYSVRWKNSLCGSESSR